MPWWPYVKSVRAQEVYGAFPAARSQQGSL
jgi:hypothetical protein